MAQQLASSLRGYFTTTPNPRANSLGAMDRAYNLGAGIAPAQLFQNATNLPEPVVYLAAADGNMNRPMPICCIFSIDTPGGPHNTGHQYAFVGDIAAPGATPSIIQVASTIFHSQGPYRVNTYGTIDAAWLAADQAATHLPRPPNDADAEDITVRRTVPVPHAYVSPILDAFHADTLTYRWLHNNVLALIQADPVQAQAYQNFANWIRVASTRGAANAAPPVEMHYQAVYGVPAVNARVPAILAQYLPGLMTPTTIHGAMTQMTQNHQQMTQFQQQMVTQITQATAAARQPRVKTLQEFSPHLHDNVLRLCEQPSIQQCPAFWQHVPAVPKGGHLGLLLQELHKNGATHNMVGPDFVADLMLARWIPSDPSKLTEGLMFTRLHSYLTPTSAQASRDAINRTYQLLGTVDTPTPRMTELVVAETKAQIPTNAGMLRAQVQSLNILLVTLAGPNTLHTQTFVQEVVNRMTEIETLINRDYKHQEKLVCLIITLWIVRTMRQTLIELADGPTPTVAIPRPVTHPPAYGDIYVALCQGNILRLQDIPSALLATVQPAPVPAPSPGPSPAPAPSPAPTANPGRGGGAGGPPSGQNQRAPVRNVNQNPRLKQAWLRAGDSSRSIYQRAGDPFYDASLPPPHKKVVMRLSGNQQLRICLPMACKGACTSTCQGYHGELTPAEEEAVAAAASPPLTL